MRFQLTVGLLLQAAFASAATSVILPLYFDPTNGAWDPLYAQLAAHPKLGFDIIINPDNGPAGSKPPSGYTAAIEKLYSYGNARVIGYIPTGYGKRSLIFLQNEVREYAAWPVVSRVEGIFFDEVQPTAYEVLAKATTFARGMLGGNESLIVFNPGDIPPNYNLYASADQVVVYEDSYAQLAGQQQSLEHYNVSRSSLSGIVYGYNSTGAENNTLSQGIFRNYGSLYLSENDGDYMSFTSSLGSFCAALAGYQM